MNTWRALSTIALVAGLFVSVCSGHPAQLVAVTVSIDPDGGFRVNATFDVLAFALNDMPAAIDDPSMNQLLDGRRDVLEARLAESRQRFEHSFAVICGDHRQFVHARITQFPTVADVYLRRDSASRSMRLPIIGELSLQGQLPSGTASVAFRFPEVMGPLVLTVQRPGYEPYSEPVEAGQTSSMLSLKIISDAPAAASAVAIADPGRVQTALKYLAMGFHHILPAGPDHILFVLGLFLLSTQVRPLLWQVTAFTVAHSITLALALYGIVHPPTAVIEPLIAISIAFIAVENLFTSNLKPWRPIVVFGFGLVHGLGFAGVLSATGLPRSQFAPALVSFNVGVELGQVAVIALAFAAVGWWQRRSWYRWAIVLPTSTAIAAIALLWTIQRVWTGI